jgi:uncharacterized coiled-coil DUF342 family protein
MKTEQALVEELARVTAERDEARAESARLQALDASRIHEVDVINAKLIKTRKERDEACAKVERLTKEFSAANSEIEKLNKERDDLQLRNDIGNAAFDACVKARVALLPNGVFVKDKN